MARKLREDVFLPREFADLGGEDQVLRVLRGLTSLNLVSADVVEVAPAYDHAEITAIAAATVIFDIIALLARRA